MGRLDATLPRLSLRTVAGAPFRARTYANLVYLALAFPLGLAYFVFVVVGLSLGVGLAVLVVGLPLVLAVLLVCVGVAAVERRLATTLLGVDIPAREWAFLERDGPVARVRGLLTDLGTWKALVYLASKLAVGVASFVLLVTLLVTSATLVATPLYYRASDLQVGVVPSGSVALPLSVQIPWQNLLVGVDFVLYLASWEVDTLPEAVALSAVGVVALVASLNVLNAFAWLVGRYARLMLGPDDWLAAARAAVR